MNEHAINRIADYFHTTPIGVVSAICLIAVVVIFAVGYACIELSTAPEPEGKRAKQ
jgi:hypothetical protein